MRREGMERLCQDLQEGKIPFLGPEDEFRWSGCTLCGLCCLDTDILLTPYDILRLRRHLGCTTSDLLTRGLVEVFPGGSSGLPLAMIAFRSAEGKPSVCPFLIPVVDARKLGELTLGQGKLSLEDLEAARIPDRFACGVYPVRPTVCRSSPLGRLTMWPVDEHSPRLFYHPPGSFCPAIQKEGRTQVARWIDDNDIKPYWDASEALQRLCSTMLGKGLVMKDSTEQAVAILWRLAASILYDFDAVSLVLDESAKNRTEEDIGEDMKFLAQLFRMVETVADSIPHVKEIPDGKLGR